MRLWDAGLRFRVFFLQGLVGITIAPNPTSGQLTVMGKELRRAEVLNMLGQHIISVNGTGDELQIDMADLPSGVYFIEIADAEGKRCVKKVMKE